MKHQLLIAAALFALLPVALPARAAAPDPAPMLLASSGVSGMPDSADKVHVQAWFPGPVTHQGTRPLSVRLHMSSGWHVNAHPASLPSLIPTTLKATAAGKPVALHTQYPPGVNSGISLGGTAIKVYSSDTTLNATLPAKAVAAAKAAGALRVTVQVQSCSNRGICLPPADLHARLPWQ